MNLSMVPSAVLRSTDVYVVSNSPSGSLPPSPVGSGVRAVTAFLMLPIGPEKSPGSGMPFQPLKASSIRLIQGS